MFRHLALAAAAALTLGAGLASAPAPAAAQAVSIQVGGPGYHGHRSNYHRPRHVERRQHCRVEKIVSRNKWGKRTVRTIRTCR